MLKNNYSLFSGHTRRVCWIQTTGGMGLHGRKDKDNSAAVDSFGARAIRAEMVDNYDIVTMDKIHRYDFALISITSVVEVENILIDIAALKPVKGNCKVVAGGMGCINIWPIIDFIDVAVFGRAEGQINDILDEGEFQNVWRKECDPGLEGKYEIRQASALLPGEAGIGCPNKCAYCQYTHVRKFLKTGDSGYRAADLLNVYEDDWNRIQFRQGRNQTAWDGLSQETRYKVRKPVSDKAIIDKLVELRGRGYPKACNIKIFQIVGYPWETPDTLRRDLMATSELLAQADGDGGRIFIMFCMTPLSPEPLTPLQAADVHFHNWREVINAWQSPSGRPRQVYKGKNIEAMILPQINGVRTLQKRIALNRCDLSNRGAIIDFVLRGKDPLSEADFYGGAMCCVWRDQTGYLHG